MSKIKYIYTIDGVTFQIFSYAVKFLGCSPSTLENAVTKAEEEGDMDFIINNRSVNIQVIKPKIIYVKYITSFNIPVYLKYSINSNGDKQLLKSMDEESFNKLDTNIEEIINYNEI